MAFLLVARDTSYSNIMSVISLSSDDSTGSFHGFEEYDPHEEQENTLDKGENYPFMEDSVAPGETENSELASQDVIVTVVDVEKILGEGSCPISEDPVDSNIESHTDSIIKDRTDSETENHADSKDQEIIPVDHPESNDKSKSYLMSKMELLAMELSLALGMEDPTESVSTHCESPGYTLPIATADVKVTVDESDLQRSSKASLDVEGVQPIKTLQFDENTEIVQTEKKKRGRKKRWGKYPVQNPINCGNSKEGKFANITKFTEENRLSDIKHIEKEYLSMYDNTPLDTCSMTKTNEKKKRGRKKGRRKYPFTNQITSKQSTADEFVNTTKDSGDRSLADMKIFEKESFPVAVKSKRGRKKGSRKVVKHTEGKLDVPVSEENKIEERVTRLKCVPVEYLKLKDNDPKTKTESRNIEWNRASERDRSQGFDLNVKCRKRKPKCFESETPCSTKDSGEATPSSEICHFREKSGTHDITHKQLELLLNDDELNVHVKVSKKQKLVSSQETGNSFNKNCIANLNQSLKKPKAREKRRNIKTPKDKELLKCKTSLTEQRSQRLRLETVFKSIKDISHSVDLKSNVNENNSLSKTDSADNFIPSNILSSTNSNNNETIINCKNINLNDNISSEAKNCNDLVESNSRLTEDRMKLYIKGRVDKITKVICSNDSSEDGIMLVSDLINYLHGDQIDHTEQQPLTQSMLQSIDKDLELVECPRRKFVESYKIVFNDDMEITCMKMGDLLHLALNDLNNLRLRLNTVRKLTCDELKANEITFAVQYYIGTLSQYKETFVAFFSKIYDQIFNNNAIVKDYKECRRAMLLTWYLKLFLRVSTLSEGLLDFLEEVKIYVITGLLSNTLQKLPFVEKVFEKYGSEFEQECWTVLDCMLDCYETDENVSLIVPNGEEVNAQVCDTELKGGQCHLEVNPKESSQNILPYQEEQINISSLEKNINEHTSIHNDSVPASHQVSSMLNDTERTPKENLAHTNILNPHITKTTIQATKDVSGNAIQTNPDVNNMPEDRNITMNAPILPTSEHNSLMDSSKEHLVSEKCNLSQTKDKSVKLVEPGIGQRSQHCTSLGEDNHECLINNTSSASDSNRNCTDTNSTFPNFNTFYNDKDQRLPFTVQKSRHGPVHYAGCAVSNRSLPYETVRNANIKDGINTSNYPVSLVDPKNIASLNHQLGTTARAQTIPNNPPTASCSSETWAWQRYSEIPLTTQHTSLPQENITRPEPFEYSRHTGQNYSYPQYIQDKINLSILRMQLDDSSQRASMSHISYNKPITSNNFGCNEFQRGCQKPIRPEYQHPTRSTWASQYSQNRVPYSCQRFSPTIHSSHSVNHGYSNINSVPLKSQLTAPFSPGNVPPENAYTQYLQYLNNPLKTLYGEDLYQQFIESQRAYCNTRPGPAAATSDNAHLPTDLAVSRTQESSTSHYNTSLMSAPTQNHTHQNNPLDYSKKPTAVLHNQRMPEARAQNPPAQPNFQN